MNRVNYKGIVFSFALIIIFTSAIINIDKLNSPTSIETVNSQLFTSDIIGEDDRIRITPTTPYTWSDITIQIPSGTSLTNCTDFSLTINNNLEARFPLNGSRTIEIPIPLNRDYEVTRLDKMKVQPMLDISFP